MRTTDPALADALWLVDHPGWTWRDLQETPAAVVDLMSRAEGMRADTAAKRASRG